jgi:hypothetical protein
MTEHELQLASAAIADELIRRNELAREAERIQSESEEKRRRASGMIAERLRQIDALYAECAKIAEENNVEFSYTNPDGVTGWYDSSGWQNSSSNC